MKLAIFHIALLIVAPKIKAQHLVKESRHTASSYSVLQKKIRDAETILKYLIEESSDLIDFCTSSMAGENNEREALTSKIQNYSSINNHLLNSAVFIGNLGLVKVYVNASADVNAQDILGLTPLHCAVVKGHEAIARFLVDQGARADTKDRFGLTASDYAKQIGSEAMNALLSTSSSSAMTSKSSPTTPKVLSTKTVQDYQEIVHMLLENIAEPSQHGPMLEFPTETHINVVRLLSVKGSVQDTMDRFEKAKLYYKTLEGHLEEVLTKMFPCIPLEKLNLYQITAGCAQASLYCYQTTKIFFDEHPDLPAFIVDVPSVLYCQASEGTLESLLAFLTEMKLNLNDKGRRGQSAVEKAVACNDVKAVENLLNAGAAADTITPGKNSLLHDALLRKSLRVVELLLDHPNEAYFRSNSENKTILHLAAEFGTALTVSRILTTGRAFFTLKKSYRAFIDLGDSQYQTALNIAERNNHEDIVKILEEFLADSAEGIELEDEAVRSNNLDVQDKNLTELLSYITKLSETAYNFFQCATLKVRSKPEIVSNPGRLLCIFKDANDSRELDEKDKVILRKIFSALLSLQNDFLAQDFAGNTPLHRVASRSHVRLVFFLLLGGAQIEALNKENRTPLLEACARNAYDSSYVLIEHGANIYAKDKKGKSPLHLIRLNIAGKGNPAAAAFRVFNKLTADPTKINDKNFSGETALHSAVLIQDRVKIGQLIVMGANVDTPDSRGQSPLHYCAKRDYLPGCEELVQRGAQLGVKDEKGRTPLHVAILNLLMSNFTFLIDSGASVHDTTNDGSTSFHLLAGSCSVSASSEDQSYEQERFARILLSKKLSLNAQNGKGETALHLAARNRNTRLVRLFIHHKVCVNLINKEGKLPLHYACSPKENEVIDVDFKQIDRQKYSESKSIIRALAIRDTLNELLAVSHSFLNVPDNFGNTPFHYWCSFRGTTLEPFQNFDAQIITLNTSGWGPLHLACYYNNISLLEELLSKREVLKDKSRSSKSRKKIKDAPRLFNVNEKIKASGKTALMIACERGYSKAVNLLLVDDLDMTACDNVLGTALHWACEFGHVNICKKLIKRGFARDDWTNINRVKLLQSACENGEDLTIEIFDAWKDWSSPDEEGNTPLHIASEKGLTEVVKCILTHAGGNQMKSIKNKQGKTAHDLAQQKGHVSVLQILTGKSPH